MSGEDCGENELESVQFKMRSEKPICAPSRLSEVSPVLPLKRFQCSSDWRWPSFVLSKKIVSRFLFQSLSPPGDQWSDWRWPSLVLSKKIVSRFLFQSLSPPGDQWCDVFGFVPGGSVSSFSTLQIFWKAKHLRGLLWPPVYLLGRFPSLRHVQGSTPTGVFEGGCRPLRHSSLGFPSTLHFL